jgi:ureidoglycolate hydrolase
LKTIEIKVQFLNQKVFSIFGDVIGSLDNKPDLENVNFNYWSHVSDITVTNDVARISLLDIKNTRPFICNSLEKHTNCSETLIPLEGQSIEVFGLPKKSSGDDYDVDISSIRAFILDGTKGINIKKGVWHWLPFPISQRALFAVIFEKNTHINDIQVLDLIKKHDIELKLNF